jgi:hypothetical protein
MGLAVGVVGQVGENPLSIILPRARDRFREMALMGLWGGGGWLK